IRRFFTTRYSTPAARKRLRSSVMAGTSMPAKLTRTTAVALSNFSRTAPMTSDFSSRVPISGLRRSTQDAERIDLDPRSHRGAHGDGPNVLPLGRRGLGSQERVDERPGVAE